MRTQTSAGRRIVVVDGYVANSGDLSWDALAGLGDLTVYDRTSRDELIERCRDAFAVITNKVVIDAAVIDALPSLRYIGVLATGYNNVDIAAARRAGITVCNVPAYSTASVAQTVFALLLAITNRAESYTASVRGGDWSRCDDFSYRLGPIEELDGMTMAVYGLGNIGSRVAAIAHAFGMKVISYTSKQQDALPPYIEKVSRDEMFRRADVLSLNAPLTAENRHFVSSATLELMKPSAILINTARGGLVDEHALAAALRDRRIAAAGIDVMDSEPPCADNPLLLPDNCIITPHIAWQSTGARRRLLAVTVDNLAAFMGGHPQNVVS